MLSKSERTALKRLVAQNESRINWYDGCFPAQVEFLNDPAPLKAALCTRRAGKSFGVGVLIAKTAYENPGVSIGVVGLTRDSIKRIYFKDIMEVLDRKHKLGIVVNKTELSMTFPNGAVIYFAGADSNEEEMNKFLGQKFKLVVIDEASMYTTIDLRKLVYDIFEPAVADYQGQIIMIGTPSDYLRSLYYDVTNGNEAGWSLHKWTVYDNPYMEQQAKQLIARILERNPNAESTPGFRQHWRGEWVVDIGARVYKFDPDINTNLVEITSNYHHVLGIDLGYEDKTAFVVGAWSHYDQVLHIVHVEAESHLTLSQVEHKIKLLQAKYRIGTIVVDGASKQGVEELQTRFGMTLYRADKQGKKDFIELLNNDLLLKKLNLLPSKCTPLIEEWEALIWDEKAREKGKWEELKSCPNHCSDAALYMWRWCYNYAAIPKAALETEEDRMERQLIEKDSQKDDSEQYSISDFSGLA